MYVFELPKQVIDVLEAVQEKFLKQNGCSDEEIAQAYEWLLNSKTTDLDEFKTMVEYI